MFYHLIETAISFSFLIIEIKMVKSEQQRDGLLFEVFFKLCAYKNKKIKLKQKVSDCYSLHGGGQ